VEIPYTLKSNKRSRSIRIAVRESGEVVVTKPTRVSALQTRIIVVRKMDWIKQKIVEMQKRPKKLLAHFSARDFKENKDRAYNLVDDKIAQFNTFYGYEIERVTIRDQSTRWGSCSKKKHLNFNYKIVFLPEALQDYIIVHELCHLKEMNHGKGFWNLVAKQIPDYKIRRKNLKLF
jgi:predicted metal-dependent hydrolase